MAPSHVQTFRVYKTTCDHDHEAIGNVKELGVSLLTRVQIRKLLLIEPHLTPMRIIENLERLLEEQRLLEVATGVVSKAKIKIPKTKDISNFLQNEKKHLGTRKKMDLGQLTAWCLKRRSVPTDLDEPFIVEYNIYFPDDEPGLRVGDCEVGDDGKLKDQIRFFVTTRRLLESYAAAKTNVHADGTYKLDWNKHPVLIVGTSDFDRKFHPFGIAVTTRETHFDYKFLFGCLDKGVDKLGLERPTCPLNLIADAAPAITNGFMESSLGPRLRTRIVCWFHVKKAIDKKLISLVRDKTKRSQLISGIVYMQLCQTPAVFKSAVELFYKKWAGDADVADFLEYLKLQWIDQNSNWYEGCAYPLNGVPLTNNGNESYNAVIKKYYTNRNQLPFDEFLDVIEKLVHDWSRLRDPTCVNKRAFSEEPTLSLAQMTAAWQWKSDKTTKKQLIQFASVPDRVWCAADDCEDIAKQIVQEYETQMKTCAWRDFDCFVNCAFSVWKVKVNRADWKKGSCTCPTFYKKYVCKHLAGVAIIKELLKVDPIAKTVPIGCNRGAGRPVKSTTALLKQPRGT